MIITKTPLRISFTGGGTDLPDYYLQHGGAVVSSGINKYIYITVSPNFENKLRISYSRTEIVDQVEEVQNDLAKEALKMVGIRKGVEITSIADIPSGTGLGSSGAFTVGVLNALHTYAGHSPSAEELASQACQIEIEILKHPIGKQDQYAAAFGGLNYFTFRPDGTVGRKNIYLDDRSYRLMRRRLMMFYTGMTRSADEVLSEQRANIASTMETLDSMKSQADAMYQELTSEGFNEKFGRALHEDWMRKQTLAGTITNPQISEYYRKALEAGALGGKLLGAGGGGFLLFYCDEQYQEDVERAVGLRRVDFHVSSRGSQVVFAD